MHGWSDFQFYLLYAVNLLTAGSYYLLPVAWGVLARWSAKAGLRFVPVFTTEFNLTRAFVTACGTHHVFMLPLMMQSHGWDKEYITLLAIDSTMAAVSVVTAARAYRQAKEKANFSFSRLLRATWKKLRRRGDD